jgi:hypothetical protein
LDEIYLVVVKRVPKLGRVEFMKEENIGSVAKFLVPDWGNEVDFFIGLSHRPASLCSLARRYDNLMSTLYPSQGLRIWLQL